MASLQAFANMKLLFSNKRMSWRVVLLIYHSNLPITTIVYELKNDSLYMDPFVSVFIVMERDNFSCYHFCYSSYNRSLTSRYFSFCQVNTTKNNTENNNKNVITQSSVLMCPVAEIKKGDMKKVAPHIYCTYRLYMFSLQMYRIIKLRSCKISAFHKVFQMNSTI